MGAQLLVFLLLAWPSVQRILGRLILFNHELITL
jgi:hypothetical protein